MAQRDVQRVGSLRKVICLLSASQLGNDYSGPGKRLREAWSLVVKTETWMDLGLAWLIHDALYMLVIPKGLAGRVLGPLLHYLVAFIECPLPNPCSSV